MGAGTWRCGCGNVAVRVRERGARVRKRGGASAGTWRCGCGNGREGENVARGRGGLVRRRKAVRVRAVVMRRENVLPLRQFARQFAHHASLNTARMHRRRHVPNSRLLQVNASIPRKNLHTHRRK